MIDENKKEGCIEENIEKFIWMKIKMKQMEKKKSYLNQKKNLIDEILNIRNEI